VRVKSQEKVKLVGDESSMLAVAPKVGERRVLVFGSKTTDCWLLKVGVKI